MELYFGLHEGLLKLQEKGLGLQSPYIQLFHVYIKSLFFFVGFFAYLFEPLVQMRAHSFSASPLLCTVVLCVRIH